MVLSILTRRQKDQFLGKTDQSVLRLGRDIKDVGIHLDASTLRRHTLVLGSARQDRSDLLLSIMSEAFRAGSGGIFINANGDLDLAAKIRSLADQTGRGNELLILDFRSGRHADPTPPIFNPFETASPERIVGIIEDVVIDSADDKRTRRRIRNMTEPLVEALCHLRDANGEFLDGAKFLEYTERERLAELGHREDLPSHLQARIGDYLDEATADDHECALMLLHQRLGFPVWDHIRIFKDSAEIDLARTKIDIADIRARREYLLVLLPALEVCGDAVTSCARLVAASIKAAFADILYETSGSPSAAGVVRPDGSVKLPFMCIFDDGSYYLPSSMPLMMSQARALGIGIVIADADLRAVYSANLRNRWPKDIHENFATTIVMRLGSWHPRFDDLLAAAELGRGHVPRALWVSRNGNPFVSARLFVNDMDSHQLLIVNSGKMVLGWMDYTPVAPRASKCSTAS